MRRTLIVWIPFGTLASENRPCTSLRALPLTPSTFTSASASGRPSGDWTCPLSGGIAIAGCWAPARDAAATHRAATHTVAIADRTNDFIVTSRGRLPFKGRRRAAAIQESTLRLGAETTTGAGDISCARRLRNTHQGLRSAVVRVGAVLLVRNRIARLRADARVAGLVIHCAGRLDVQRRRRIAAVIGQLAVFKIEIEALLPHEFRQHARRVGRARVRRLAVRRAAGRDQRQLLRGAGRGFGGDVVRLETRGETHRTS